MATAVASGGQGGQSAAVWRIAGHLAQSFEKLWAEPFGFLAIGLAGLQGVFGIVLLWGMGTERSPAPLSPPARQRPIPRASVPAPVRGDGWTRTPCIQATIGGMRGSGAGGQGLAGATGGAGLNSL